MAPDSIVRTSIASFFKVLLGVIGFGVGLVLLFAGISAIVSTPSGTTAHTTTLRMLPDETWKIKNFSRDTPTILRIDINGVIGLDHIRKEDIQTILIESQDGDLKPGQVKGIILHINSPGGVADEADAIYRSLLEYKERFKVPVIAYVDGLSASGGMYIACAADKIYATEDSIIGHIGVLLSPPFFNFSKVMDKLGIQSKTFSAGKHKDDMNPFRPWQEGEGQNFQTIVDFMYERFMGIVATHRPKLTKEILLQEGAQIYPAPIAEELGYIDSRVYSMNALLKEFSTELGIHEGYQFVQLEKQSFLEELFGGTGSMLFDHKIEHYVRMPGDLHPDLYGKPLYLYHP